MIIGGTKDWHNTVYGSSVQLIDYFVSHLEEQIDETIQKYKVGRVIEPFEHDCEEYGVQTELVESYRNLNTMDFGMETLIEEHFPSLQRRAALITVCSLFEDELFGLCEIFRVEKTIPTTFYDFRTKKEGMAKSTEYLQKYANLKDLTTSPEWRAVNWVRLVRNAFVHRNGRKKQADGYLPPELKVALENLLFWHDDREQIVLDKGFVPQAVDIFKRYFTLVDSAIDKTPRT